jgi:Transcriptional regulator, AbiEi antitoxin N-terminal domain
MAKRNEGKLNYLERILPEGLLVDAAWLSKKGYSTSLRSQYVSAGWLEQPARQVYRRPRGSLGWQQVVISLQTLLGCRLSDYRSGGSRWRSVRREKRPHQLIEKSGDLKVLVGPPGFEPGTNGL